MTEIATVQNAEVDKQETMQLLLFLEDNGLVDEVSLDLSGVVDLTPERWKLLGQFFGGLGRRVNWYVGDWVNWGEDNFGEDVVVQEGVEGSVRERYSEAERVTGLDHGTLMNISSICRRVAKARRRKELGFWIHAEVAPLDPEEQTGWLQRAIDEGWNRGALRDAIRDAKGLAGDDDAPPDDDEGSGGVSHSERLEQAARIVWHQSQPTSDGQFVVPAEAMNQLATALGEGQ